MPNITNYKIVGSLKDKEWDDFVHNHKFGRFSQLSAFQKTVLKSYDLKSYNVGFYDTRKNLKGIFPTILIKDYFGRRKLVSMPFSDYGGFLFNEKAIINDNLIVTVLDNLLNISGASTIEIRGSLIGMELFDDHNLNKIFFNNHVCESASLEIKEEIEIYNELARSVRKNLKRSQKRKLVCKNDNSGEVIEGIFYPLYVKKMKKFGTPPHSLKYFLNLRKYFGDNLIILFAEYNHECVSILFAIKTNNILNIIFTISFGDDNKLRANDFLHWEMIKYSIAKKCRLFDFGTVKHEGQKRYKLKWGSRIKNYSYFRYPKSRGIHKYKAIIDQSYLNKIWAEVMPNSLSKILGPILRKVTGR